VVKVDGLVVSAPGSRNATSIVTPMKYVLLQSEEARHVGRNSFWQKHKLRERSPVLGAACARTDVDTIVFYGHIKRGRNYLLMPNPNYMPAASRGSDQAAN
jgi:hypothetical protein